MANKDVKIKLTADQQKQIKEATGKKISELTITSGAKVDLSEKELAGVVGGAKAGIIRR
jgi:hypothetical protein